MRAQCFLPGPAHASLGWSRQSRVAFRMAIGTPRRPRAGTPDPRASRGASVNGGLAATRRLRRVDPDSSPVCFRLVLRRVRCVRHARLVASVSTPKLRVSDDAARRLLEEARVERLAVGSSSTVGLRSGQRPAGGFWACQKPCEARLVFGTTRSEGCADPRETHWVRNAARACPRPAAARSAGRQSRTSATVISQDPIAR